MLPALPAQQRPSGVSQAVRWVRFLWVIASAALVPTTTGDEIESRRLEFFESRIRPVLVGHCLECHGADGTSKGGLRVDSREALLRGGKSGPAIRPGDPDGSSLIQAVRHTLEDRAMPRNRPRLPDTVVADLVRWVRDGAADPRREQEQAAVGDTGDWETVFRSRSERWCFQPVKPPAIPEVRDPSWASDPVDRFILSRLEAANLRPAGPASPQAWLRRVHFTLTGLPPAPETTLAFLADPSDTAKARIVDQLLASPRFGERWARHWMDLIRFAETYGHEQDYPIAHAWRYRDYLIRAFNEDVPYDQFVAEHIAGDLLPEPRRATDGGWNESVIATGFWYLHQATHSPVDLLQDEADRIDNQVDVFSKTFLGLTVSCARCHHHKFDAISMEDYYGLTAFLRGSRQDVARLDPEGSLESQISELGQLHERQTPALRSAVHRALKDGAPRLTDYLLAAQAIVSTPPGTPSTNHTDHPSEAETRVAAQQGLDAGRLQRWVKALRELKPGDATHPLAWTLPRTNSPPATIPTASPRPGDRPIALDSGQIFASGHAFPVHPTGTADWRFADDRIEFLPAGVVHSGHLAPGLEGTLRSATFTLTEPNIHLRLAGRGGRVRLILGRYALREFNPLLFERTQFDVDTDGRFQWFSIPNLQRHLGKAAYLEFMDGGDGDLAVDQAVLSQDATPPPNPAPLWAPEAGNDPASQAAAVERSIREALHRWSRGEDPGVGLDLISWLSRRGLLDWGRRDKAIAALAEESRRATAKVGDPIRALAMTRGTPETTRVLLRGDPRKPGAEIPPRFPKALSPPRHDGARCDGGRLELASRMTDPANPLTHRVFVNRIWAHLFGVGLVPSVDNFGAMGQDPTHPELLDHLVVSFRSGGGSTKTLIRRLCLTRTFGMSSTPSDPDAEQRDPENTLLHRMRLRRLEGEAVRDSLLAVSQRLDGAMFGPSIPTHFTPFMGDRMWVRTDSGPLDGAGRRTVYQETRRNFLSPFLLAFDLPIPDSTVGRRSVSNVPGQSLALMNDPFIRDQARVWAGRLLAGPSATPRERVRSLYLEALGRLPEEGESEALLRWVESQNGEPSSDVWTEACHVMFLLKEFRHVP
jgi:hypothetical protein